MGRVLVLLLLMPRALTEAMPGWIATMAVEAPRMTVATASWYGPGFHLRPTASGLLFRQDALTAAHRTLPFGTRLRLYANGRTVTVTITDRGPFIAGRDLDLSRGAARRLGMLVAGVIDVAYDVL